MPVEEQRGAAVSAYPRAVQKLYFEEGEFTSVPIFRPGEMNERCCVVCLSACVDTVLQPCRHMSDSILEPQETFSQELNIDEYR